MKAIQRQIFSIVILFVLVFSQFVTAQPAYAATTRFVIETGGVTTGPCDSWAAACTLQRALTAAVAGDDVWVQQGTYKPGTLRSDTFIIKDGVAVYGGFVGTETARDERNTKPANTILSGDIGVVNDFSDNSEHVITIDNAGVSTVMDGFTVTRGNANAGNDYGGGIYITNSSPIINNVIITNNRAGNTVGSGGGGMYIADTNGIPIIVPQISNVTFSNNQSGRGGGLFSQNADPRLTNVVFQSNAALATGGGGMNSQTVGSFDPPINPVLTNVSFINNTATGGGGMFLGNSTGTLTNVTFVGNSATRRGGGMLLEVSTGVLTNVTFNNNTSTNTAGVSPRGGGGLMVLGSNPTLNNITFSGNTSTANGESGSAIRVAQEPNTLTNSNPVITNSILWGDNTTEITSDGTGSITISDSVVEGGFTGTNILTTDPLLNALADNGGFTQTMALSAGSSAINTGNNITCAATDQRGVSRPFGAACDMGAYEYDVVTGGSFTDITAANFNAGTVGSCLVDAGIGDGALKLDLPSTSCVFESRVFDAGDLVDWINVTSTVTTPAGTSLVLEVRTGNTDGTWTTWQDAGLNPLNNFGGRYIQYKATLETTNDAVTPVLEDVTINYTGKQYAILGAPSGTLSDWDHSFNWTGRATATHHLLEVYKSDNTLLLWKWYTAAQAGCDGGTACTVSPTETLGLANGDYKWRVADYDTTDGYGVRTNFVNFTLSGACYTLTTGINPSGSGSVNVSAQNCAGGYTVGTVVQVSVASSITGYTFANWSGDASGNAYATTVTMTGNKSVTANFRGETLLAPTGILTSWNNSFSWTGHAAATHYLLEVQKTDNTVVLRKWYTSTQTGCAGGSACSISPSELSTLANGDYKWHMRDYGAYGYGSFTPYTNFTLSGACYTLTTNASPSAGGTVTAGAQNCPGGYTAGTVVQVSVVPNTGFTLSGWSNDASGTAYTTTVTMTANKTATANLRGETLISPTGVQSPWNNVFTWTGHAAATHYLVEVQKLDNTVVHRIWYTSTQTGCAGGTACSISPVQLTNLASGDYKWHMRDYGAYGYGSFTPYMNFSIP